MTKTTVPDTTSPASLAGHLRLYERSLRAANRADATVYKYVLAARQLIAYLDANGMPPTRML